MAQFEEAGHVPYQILDRASVGSMTELFNVLELRAEAYPIKKGPKDINDTYIGAYSI